MGKIRSVRNRLWLQEFGTPERDAANGIAADKGGHVYVTGYITGDVNGNFNGVSEAYVARFDAVPEPSTVLLANQPTSYDRQIVLAVRL